MGIRLQGFPELEETLKQLPRATGRNVLGRALKNAAKPIQQKAQSLAPKDTGALRKSIIVEEVKGKSGGKSAFAAARAAGASIAEARAATAGTSGETKAEVRIGPRNGLSKSDSIKTIVQEFGSVKQAAQPYIRPAWDAHKDGASASVKTELWKEIEKAVARRAKAAAKRAAKG
jgi:HK97 gp10 family phage protein